MNAHVHIADRAPQPVMDGGVDELSVSDPVAGARARQQVWPQVHVLHAARHDHIRVPGADRRGADHHRLEPRTAHLVDGGRAHAVGQTGLEGRLPRGCLSGPGLDDLAHDRLVDALGRDPRPLHRGADGGRTQLGGRHSRKPGASDWDVVELEWAMDRDRKAGTLTVPGTADAEPAAVRTTTAETARAAATRRTISVRSFLPLGRAGRSIALPAAAFARCDAVARRWRNPQAWP